MRVLRCGPDHPTVRAVGPEVCPRAQPTATQAQLHDPEWLAANSRSWDVVHLHLGLSACDPDLTAAAVAVHRDAGTPVAVTIHDRTTPDGQVDLLDLLRRLDPHVAGVIAPTAAWAEQVEHAVHRPVRVLPHGPVLSVADRARMRAHRRRRSTAGPLLLIADRLAPHMGWLEAVEASARTVHDRPMQVLADAEHVDVVRRATTSYPRVDVRVQPGRDPAALARSVAGADALVLPWRWGGHSWLVELAADVGTPVLATDVGFLADQQPMRTAACRDGEIDIDELAAVMDAHTAGDVAVEVGEAARAAAAATRDEGHRRLYRWLALGGTSPWTGS